MAGPLFARVRGRRARLCLAAAVAVALGSNWRQIHARPVEGPPLPLAMVPGAGQRVLVFAPHPDDETLAVGGLIHESIQRGAKVRVVYLTNGDAFRLCAAASFRGWPDERRMQRLAGVRQKEARAAFARLGGRSRNTEFLGYPDRGLATLWISNWSDDPYRSPYTGHQQAAGPGTSTNPYTGEAALLDVEAILQRFRPDEVYYPDAADDHPDHWATHCLVQLALERSRQGGVLKRRTYLIHRGEWPLPQRADPSLELTPPPVLREIGTNWETVPLTSAAVRAKSDALGEYDSQQPLVGGFLASFVRGNELLGVWEERGATLAMRSGVAPALRFPAEGLFADASTRQFPDPTRDRFARANVGGVDYEALEVESGGSELRLQAVLRGPAVPWASYYLYWKPVDGHPGDLETRRYRIWGYRCSDPDVRFAIDGRRVGVTVPNALRASTRRIMVAASVWSGPILLDRTPWRVVTVK
jgi:LmbE family N-acetylglucosaminyl deacetylase